MNNTIKIWVDDVRYIPNDYDFWSKSVWDFIRNFEQPYTTSHLEIPANYIIDLDHDAGEYSLYGGDYINILKWFEFFFEDNKDYVKEHVTFKFHTSNPVGKDNMKHICERNGWKFEM